VTLNPAFLYHVSGMLLKSPMQRCCLKMALSALYHSWQEDMQAREARQLAQTISRHAGTTLALREQLEAVRERWREEVETLRPSLLLNGI